MVRYIQLDILIFATWNMGHSGWNGIVACALKWARVDSSILKI